MKLRNKKTGKVLDLECITVFDRPGKNDIGDSIDEFYTIAELNEEWEDYTTSEPLIKDEKIRKAVRAWAEVNWVKKALIDSDYTIEQWNAGDVQLSFSMPVFEDIKGGTYTITELCGEEEE